MSDDNTVSITMEFDKNLKEKKKFKVNFDKIDAISDVTLIKGEIAGVDPYCIKVGKKLYCFP